MRYHYAPIRISRHQNADTPNAGKNVEQRELSFIACGHANGTAILEDILADYFLQN